MTKWIHVVLVGTSVLRNLTNKHPELQEPATNPTAHVPEEVERNAPRYAEEVARDPRKLSAELNAMHPYLEENTVHKVVLLYTSTDPGRLAARILYHALKKLKPNLEVTAREVKELGTLFEEGAVNLVDTLAETIEEARREGYRVALNLTGGFKVEAAYALLAGALLGASKAYYIHEAHRTVAELPLPPITITSEALHALKLLEKGLVEAAKQKHLGLIEELRERGLLDQSYNPRKWVKKILEKTKKHH